jgi:hypothetical protein
LANIRFSALKWLKNGVFRTTIRVSVVPGHRSAVWRKLGRHPAQQLVLELPHRLLIAARRRLQATHAHVQWVFARLLGVVALGFVHPDVENRIWEQPCHLAHCITLACVHASKDEWTEAGTETGRGVDSEAEGRRGRT